MEGALPRVGREWVLSNFSPWQHCIASALHPEASLGGRNSCSTDQPMSGPCSCSLQRNGLGVGLRQAGCDGTPVGAAALPRCRWLQGRQRLPAQHSGDAPAGQALHGTPAALWQATAGAPGTAVREYDA
jgi:hypothetical protein